MVYVGNGSRSTKSLFDHPRSSRTRRNDSKGGNRICRHVCDRNRRRRAASLHLRQVHAHIFYKRRLLRRSGRRRLFRFISLLLFRFAVSFWLPSAIVIYYLAATLKLVIQSAIEGRRLTLESNGTTGGVSEQVATPLYKSKPFWYVIALVASNALLPQTFILVYTLQSFLRVDSYLFQVFVVIFTTNFLLNTVLYPFLGYDAYPFALGCSEMPQTAYYIRGETD